MIDFITMKTFHLIKGYIKNNLTFEKPPNQETEELILAETELIRQSEQDFKIRTYD